MITGKDLDYICDILDQNYVFMKKCCVFSNMLTNENIVDEVRNIYNVHKEHYQRILNLLNQGGNQ